MHPTHTLPGNGTDPSRRLAGDPVAKPATAPTAIRALVTPAVTLRATALYLDRHGWCQGSYYDQAATVFTPAACLVGALGMVCYGGPVDAPALNYHDPRFGEFDAAYAYLDRYLLDRYELVAYEFNDARGRTADEVIAALRSAADEWDRTHGGDA